MLGFALKYKKEQEAFGMFMERGMILNDDVFTFRLYDTDRTPEI